MRPSAPPPPKPIAAPTKTSADIQAEEERKRFNLAASSKSFASTILTSGLGDRSAPTLGGVTLGV